ncbi:transposase, partial [uncultured Microbacterium sp.]|uniref:transposase n=1 Tax=uncultured Microbacterium sp. TaxID=191216 RepID=UPI002631688F
RQDRHLIRSRTQPRRSTPMDIATRPSNGPTEGLNGRLEHLRGSALGFRNLTNYIARSLLETGGFRPQPLHPRLG